MPIDYSEYPPNWKTEIRPMVLERAGNCCEECGVRNHSLIWRYGKGKQDYTYWPEGMESEAWTLDGRKATKVVLTIAHLDHDKHNHDISIDRLRAWCQKCHLAYDMSRHIENRKKNKELKSKQIKLL